jgi:hypothetical protein
MRKYFFSLKEVFPNRKINAQNINSSDEQYNSEEFDFK